MEYTDILALASFLRVATHPSRLDIIFILDELDELPVSALQNEVEISKQAMSAHLAQLENVDIITTRRQGRTKLISLKRKDLPQALRALNKIH